MISCQNPSDDVFTGLLNKHPEVFKRDIRGWTVAHHAIYNKRFEYLTLMTEHKYYNYFDWNDDMNTPL